MDLNEARWPGNNSALFCLFLGLDRRTLMFDSKAAMLNNSKSEI